jgi:hypothetical protein
MVLAMAVVRSSLLIALLLLMACGDPAKDLARAHDARDDGHDPVAETVLREALERYPDDLELLLFAADFYLRPEAEDFYKPRLSLHYAMRADRASNYQEPRATRAMVMAHRGAGGFDEAQPLIRDGLAGLGHPDAEDPIRLEPVDPDLLEPSLPNLLEQRRRQTEGRPTPTCAEGMRLVPEGDYPGAASVETFCVEQGARAVLIGCETLELRSCTPAETAVADGPIAALLDGDSSGFRCCADPVIARIPPVPVERASSVVGDR